MATYWVCKPDGVIQCQDIAAISLADMRKTLALLVGDDTILAQEKRHVLVPTLCGIPAGSRNAYELTEDGYYLLVHGIAGRMGFVDCPDRPAAEAPSEDPDPVNFGHLLAVSSATSATTIPVLVRDLIGTPVRVYEQGSAITKDYRPDRTNIVTVEDMILDIWFG